MRKRKSTGALKLDLNVFVPLLISLIIVFAIFLSINYLYGEPKDSSLQDSLGRETVLELLEADLEFCDIKREELSLDSDKFWMICNDRPYYAEFENGNIISDMNGWSFLREQPGVFNDLTNNNCDFLYSKNNNLFFYCDNGIVKIYYFDVDNFKLENGRDEEFTDVVHEDIKEFYNCSPYDYDEFVHNEEMFSSVKLTCNYYDTILNFNLNKTSYSFPIIVDEKLPFDEKARIAFQILSICRLDYIRMYQNEYSLNIFCEGSEENLVINYDLDSGISSIIFSETDFENIFSLIKAMVFPFSSDDAELEYLTSQEDNPNRFDFYRYDGKILVTKIVKDDSIIFEMYLKNEGFNGDKYQ
ncbi:MAG: hypothetical protein KKF44_07685 [Nanoarchaeota archaeon]|nr:hypothetical protein [Nanoarchaeota archaeon]